MATSFSVRTTIAISNSPSPLYFKVEKRARPDIAKSECLPATLGLGMVVTSLALTSYCVLFFLLGR